jgi:PEP-CTERM motif
MDGVARLMRLRLVLICAAALVIGPASRVSAVPIAIDFSATGLTTAITGTGTVVVDSTLLAPNTFTDDLLDLQSLTLTLTGIPDSPSTTTFTESDLAFWFFETDGLGTIVDLNFLMRGLQANADGYAIEGVDFFTFLLCDGAATTFGCVSEPEIDRVTVEVTDIRPVVPEPAILTLLGLGLAGMSARRWRQRKHS